MLNLFLPSFLQASSIEYRANSGNLSRPDAQLSGARPTVEELKARFAVFDQSDTRFRLFEKLKGLIDQARWSGIVKRLLVVGSFVTAKAEPNDFDCLVVFCSSIVGQELAPVQYNLVSRRMARRLYGGDVTPALQRSAALEDYLEFFQTSREGNRMGIVEIQL
jgi:hypothetical protein